jgi:hypothetical protein
LPSIRHFVTVEHAHQVGELKTIARVHPECWSSTAATGRCRRLTELYNGLSAIRRRRSQSCEQQDQPIALDLGARRPDRDAPGN